MCYVGGSKCDARAGSNDSSTFPLEMPGELPVRSPWLSHADLDLPPLSMLLPSAQHITPLSSGLAVEVLSDFQVTPIQ